MCCVSYPSGGSAEPVCRVSKSGGVDYNNYVGMLNEAPPATAAVPDPEGTPFLLMGFAQTLMATFHGWWLFFRWCQVQLMTVCLTARAIRPLRRSGYFF
jgi:hypothetical protein